MQEQSTPQDHSAQTSQAIYHPTIKAPPHFPLNNKEIILDEHNFSKSLLTHSKTSKSAGFTQIHGRDDRQFSKDCQKVLRTQHQLSKLNFDLETAKYFESKSLLSQIQYFSSLSSLTLEFVGFSRTSTRHEKVLFKNLISLKQLQNIELYFSCLIINDPELFKNLTKTLRKATKMTNLSLAFFSCFNLTSLHYTLLLSRLPKLNHLRSLKLNFSHSDDFQEADINTLTFILPKLSFLTKINLSIGGSRRRILQGSALIKLFKAFRSIKNLSDLRFYVSGWELVSREHEKPLLESLNCLVGSSIKRLDLSLFRNFSNKNLQELSEALKKFTFLESFRFAFFEGQLLEDESFAHFGLALACMVSLTSLSLFVSYKITNKNIVQVIATALASLQKLVSLRLELRCESETEDEQVQALFANIKSSRFLKYLYIDISKQKKIADASLEVLEESLKYLNALRNISLAFGSNSRITNKGIEAICSGLQEGPKGLFYLSLFFGSHENVNEKALGKIGKTLQSLGFLYSFSLELRECFQKTDLEEFFGVLIQMKNIQEIWLSFPNSKGNFREVDWLKKKKNATVCLLKGK